MTLKFHRNRSTMRTQSSLMTLLLGLACAFSSSAVSLVPYNLYTLILGFILPIYAWRGPQAQQETGQNTGLVPSGTTAETTLPLAPSPSLGRSQAAWTQALLFLRPALHMPAV